MARLRGALPVLVTIAVAAGLSYVLIGPPWPEDDASRSPGVLPEPIAGSEAQFERSRPDDTVLHDLNEEELKARRAERSRFMEGNILPPDEE